MNMSTRSVHWLTTVQSQFVHSLDEYTEAEFNACWYSEKEYSKIEKRIMKERKLLEQGKVFKDKKYCSRGLESYQAYICRKQNYGNAMQSVLDEQDRQIESDEYNHESIAQAYRNVSSSCHMWAAAIGLRDQKEAESCIDDKVWENVTKFSVQPSKPSKIPATKSHISSSMRPMTILKQVAVSARTA